MGKLRKEPDVAQQPAGFYYFFSERFLAQAEKTKQPVDIRGTFVFNDLQILLIFAPAFKEQGKKALIDDINEMLNE